MKQIRILFLLAELVVTAGQITAQSPAPVTVVKAGRLLDPRTGNVVAPAAVLIENGKIKEVGAPARVQAAAPADVKIIDLGGATLLPGLIDSHTHLLLDVIVPPEAEITRRYNGEFVPGLLLAITMSPTKRVLLGVQMAREDLKVVSLLCAISATPASMAMSPCGTPSTPGASPARGSWRLVANLRRTVKMGISRVSIPLLPRRSCNKSFWR
jgi:hypothetical protein